MPLISINFKSAIFWQGSFKSKRRLSIAASLLALAGLRLALATRKILLISRGDEMRCQKIRNHVPSAAKPFTQRSLIEWLAIEEVVDVR